MKYNTQIVADLFAQSGYKLLDDYKNMSTKMRFICCKHSNRPIQMMSLGGLKNDNQKCAYCQIENNNYHRPYPDDILEEMVSELGYEYIDKETVNNKTVIKYICPNHRDRGIQTAPFLSIKEKHKVCKFCNGRGRDIEELRNLMHNINENIQVIDYLPRKNGLKVVSCKCKIDDCEWQPLELNLLKGQGCPECGRRGTDDAHRIPQDKKMEILYAKHNDINFLSTPRVAIDKVKCECKRCGHIWEAMYYNLSKENSTSCPACRFSHGEKKIAKYLKEWGFKYIPQKIFDDLQFKRKLRFDFYLPEHNILIEYDGQFHYSPIIFKGQPYEYALFNYDKTVKSDIAKESYCKSNKIPLIRIPYWEYEYLEYSLFDNLVKYNAIKLVS